MSSSTTSLDVPQTGKTWLQTTRGKPRDVLVLKENHPVPTPGPGEVIVKVHSVALNPVGYKMMGLLPWPLVKLPIIPEQDFSGTVVDPNGSSSWKKGDQVLGLIEASLRFKQGKGTMSEYIVVGADKIVPKPDNIPFEEAAGIVTVGLTAFQVLSLPDHEIKPGQSIFINGGATAVGQAAIQIAKRLGLSEIEASCSSEKSDFVKGFGASKTYDYRKAPLIDQLKAERAGKPYDLFFDAVGAPDLFCEELLKPTGIFATITATASTLIPTISAAWCPKYLGGAARAFKVVSKRWNEKQLRQLVDWMEQDLMKLPIDQVYTSDREGVMAAYDKQMSGRAKGKVIVNME